MKVEPGGAELLRAARETLLEELLPRLPAESHYAARMAANAMAIAARELESESGDEEAELARIRALVPGAHANLREANAALAAAIRSGRFDDPQAQRALAAHLRLATDARLRISNPGRK